MILLYCISVIAQTITKIAIVLRCEAMCEVFDKHHINNFFESQSFLEVFGGIEASYITVYIIVVNTHPQLHLEFM